MGGKAENTTISAGVSADVGDHLPEILLELGNRHAADVVIVHAKAQQHEVGFFVQDLRLQTLETLHRGIAPRGAVDRRDAGARVGTLQCVRPTLPEDPLRLRGVAAGRDAVAERHDSHRRPRLELGLGGTEELGLVRLDRPGHFGGRGVIDEGEVPTVAEAGELRVIKPLLAIQDVRSASPFTVREAWDEHMPSWEAAVGMEI